MSLLLFRSMKRIVLNNGDSCLVDDVDYPQLAQFKWSIHRGYFRGKGTLYAARWFTDAGGRRKALLMHREILDAPKGMLVDHRNHNGLDNRRSNIRLCDSSKNQANRGKQAGCYSSQFKGVHWDTERGKWRAILVVKNRRMRLGRFDCEVDAAKAYNEAANRCFGQFAMLNPV